MLVLFSVNLELVSAVERGDGLGGSALLLSCVAVPLVKLLVR